MAWVKVGNLKGDTGATGPVVVDQTLNKTSTNAIQNSPVATAIENLQNDIGTITVVQNENLNLLGS
ncbi:MAG: hypothetical protein HUK28_07620 [Methanobrevibacter sp.]|nr:hypothetical protein [Methanobrevibacter sp.]